MSLKRSIVSFIDIISRATAFIDFAHHEIHEGDAFVTNKAATLASSATITIRVLTPDSEKQMHFIASARSSAESNVMIYEGATISDGTAQAVYNRNRSSVNVTAATVTHTPTISARGTTIIAEVHLGAGQTRGGEARGTSEYILARNTEYLIELTSEAAGNDCQLILDWYEHTALG